MNRIISTKNGEEKAKKLDVLFIETSAKSGYNVKKVNSFHHLISIFAKDNQISVLTFYNNINTSIPPIFTKMHRGIFLSNN